MTFGALAGTMRIPQPDRYFPFLPLIPLAALPFAGTDPTTIDQVIVAMEIIFLLMGLRHPTWVLGALVLSELSLKNYYLDFGGQVSTRLFIAMASMVIAMPLLTRPWQLSPRARPVFVGLGFFFVTTTIANAIGSDMAYTITFARFLTTGCIAVILVAILVQTREDLMQIARVAFVVGMASAVAGVLQHYEFKGAPVFAVVPNAVLPVGLDEWGGRVLGLTEHPVYLSNDLFLLAFPLLAMLMLRVTPERSIPSLIAVVLIVLAALYFTQTRSWIYSAVAAIIVMSLVVGGRRRQELLILLVIFSGVFWYWSERTGNRYTLGPESDDSAATRPVLWSAGLNIALDNPMFGVGHNAFLELSPEYANRIDDKLLKQQGAGGALGTYTPHNDPLNIWLSFGTPALFSYIAVAWYTASNFVFAYKTLKDPLLRAVSVGCLGTLVAFIVNSMFHNFFDSTLLFWVMAGLSIALCTLAAKDEDNESESEVQTWNAA